MPTRREIEAIRLGVAVAAMDHVSAVKISGEDAFTLLDAVVPRALFVRDGQLMPTLLLDEQAHPIADLTVCVDDLDYVLLCEGMSGEALITWLQRQGPSGLDVTLEDLTPEVALIGLHGPYAWELLAELVGPEVVGVPYLTSFALLDYDGTCFRAGKTGEFGYKLMIPRARREELWGTLLDLGAHLEVVEVGLEALDLCALENGFFCMRHPGVTALTPVELQLLWRVSLDRTFPGSQALAQQRAEATERLTWFLLDPDVAVPPPGAVVSLPNADIGRVVHAARSPLLGRVVGMALITERWAHPGAQLQSPGPGRTISPPALNNRSLFMDAQRHTFASRALDDFPALLPEEA